MSRLYSSPSAPRGVWASFRSLFWQVSIVEHSAARLHWSLLGAKIRGSVVHFSQLFLNEHDSTITRGSSGGANRGHCPPNSESKPPSGLPTGSLHQQYNDKFLAMILYWRERWKYSVSAVYYPIKIVEIVNTILSEWGICPFSELYVPPNTKAGPNLVPLLKLV